MTEDFAALPLPMLVSAAVGGLLPVLLAMVNRSAWRPGTKQAIMLAGVALGTAATMLVTGALIPEARTVSAWASSLLVCYLTTVASYKANWKPSGVTDRVEVGINAGKATGSLAVAVEAATAPEAEVAEEVADPGPIDEPRRAEESA